MKKIYLCWSGAYSDRTLEAAFSDIEEANKYIQLKKAMRGYAISDDKPEEFFLDAISVIIPEKCLWQVVVKPSGLVASNEKSEIPDGKTTDTLYIDKNTYPYYYIETRFAEIKTMQKAAIEKASGLYARDIGL